MAVALRYQQEKEKAPRVIASGRNYVAQRILQVAQEENIPIHEDSSMTELLSKLELGDEIPPELYGVMAELFAFIYGLERSYKEQRKEIIRTNKNNGFRVKK
ncbi:EscU/YscU/HrcU family type III secretion system export apparatus switch protein [Heliorestis convoluta]|uniref:Flhb domain protein, putative n=1 Tax=Heliorestis convoluta TaxID=356322 RepID=A0A5Q2N4A9_9FIRM|nr:EscU/YscU/HrcU family type III secretion system export apparatus switch protein [Heliorestis convoluta]QGG48142.1 Flhb domain protein, putative [Heliorestis convoluta]